MSTVEPWILEAIRACEPDEQPLRALVLQTLRQDPELTKTIAYGDSRADEDESEASLATLNHFVEHGAWPAKDDGWLVEAAGLSGYSYWLAGDQPDEVNLECRDDDGRPNRELTIRCVVSCFLVGDLRSNSVLGGMYEEPTINACLIVADGAARLGVEWERAALRWFAWIAIRCAEEETWPSIHLESLVCLFMLSVRGAGLRGDQAPLSDLLCAIDVLSSSCPYEKDSLDDMWLVTRLAYLHKPRQLLRVSEVLLEPVVGLLQQADGTAVGEYLSRLRADRERVERISSNMEADTELGWKPWSD